jgi:Bifunctional DNA primase/polymerase, N-terminal
MTSPADNQVLRAALACARQGWPVFPCHPGRKSPATPHGYLDATTDPAQIRAWFFAHPELNLAVATGAPGPDVLDVDYRGPDEDGYPALGRLHDAGLLTGAYACIQTPSNGMHVYFAGSHQRSGHLPGHHIDFLAQGGYVLVPPSKVGGRPYAGVSTPGERGTLDWEAAVQVLEPSRARDRQSPQPAVTSAEEQMDRLARWVAFQREGNRNAGLFWAANRALEADPAADLTPLAAAAFQTGLDEHEIHRTLDSARRTSQARRESPSHETEPPGHEAEGSS